MSEYKVTRREYWTTEQQYEVELTYMEDDDENDLFVARTRHLGKIVDAKGLSPEAALGNLSAAIGVTLVAKRKVNR